jgi:hypothetical protein
VLSEVGRLASATGKSAHERYLTVFLLASNWETHSQPGLRALRARNGMDLAGRRVASILLCGEDA